MVEQKIILHGLHVRPYLTRGLQSCEHRLIRIRQTRHPTARSQHPREYIQGLPPRSLEMFLECSERLFHPRSQNSSMRGERSEEHTSELQSLMRISSAVFCWKKKSKTYDHTK